MPDETVIVVAGGRPPDPRAVLGIPSDAPVIAADGGLAHARALGLHVEAAVGDFDSIEAAALDDAADAGARVLRHPAEKDSTDLELALDAALEREPSRVLVLAGDGGRLDHLLGVLLLLASPRYARVRVEAAVGRARVYVVRDEHVFSGRAGDLVSLFAVHGRAEGVSTEGLFYPLASETLEPGSTRGVSNVFAEDTARVSVERGVVLAIVPGAEGEDAK